MIEVRHDTSLEALRAMPDGYASAMVTDPPAGIGFMGKAWDRDHGGRDRWVAEFAGIFREARRVCRPGSHALVWALPRTAHWTATALEDAGWEVRDVVLHVFGTGFSKGFNLGNRNREAICACEEAETSVHRVRGDVRAKEQHRAQQGEVLRDEVLRGVEVEGPDDPSAHAEDLGIRPRGCEAGSATRHDGPEEPVLEGRVLHRTGEGLPPDSPPFAPEGESERLRAGAHTRRGVDAREAARGRRGGSPPQPRQVGQPAGEFADLREPPSALDTGAPGDRHRCSRCGLLSPEFAGFATGLKPAAEHWILCRAPLSGTVAATVAVHGTGALNVEACRVPSGSDYHDLCVTQGLNSARTSYVVTADRRTFEPSSGRWPPNLVLTHDAECAEDACADGCPVEEMGRQSGESVRVVAHGRRGLGFGGARNDGPGQGYTVLDTGTAARFFPRFRYQAKPSRSEREAGLDHLPRRAPGFGAESLKGVSHTTQGERLGNHHPTVKPVALMRWLCRLVTPPGGIVLDPFGGSGTTGVACAYEGFDAVLIEREPEYVEIARARIAHALAEATRAPEPPAQLDLLEVAS